MKCAKFHGLFVLGLCAVMAAACTSGGKVAPNRSPATSQSAASVSHTEPPDTRLVIDGAPYWCDLVPKEAFRRVSGIAGNLVERWGAHRAENGTCLVRDQEEYGPLGVGWMTGDVKKKVSGRMERIRADISNDAPKRLPSQLGFGFTAYAPGEDDSAPYVAVAVFRCGDREPLIDIDLRRVSEGRNATKDLADLMWIAQKRFGDIHHCTPKPK